MDVFEGVSSPQNASATYNDSLYRDTMIAGNFEVTPTYYLKNHIQDSNNNNTVAGARTGTAGSNTEGEMTQKAFV